MKHFIDRLILFALVFAVLFAFAACGGSEDVSSKNPASSKVEEEDPNWPVSLDDIDVKEKPSRVISLSPALTELIYELGYEDALVGVSAQCDFPDEARALPTCGTAQLPDMEQIKKLKPELIFSSMPLTQEDTVALQQMNAQVFVLPHVDSFEELRQRYENAGTVLGGNEDGYQNGSLVFDRLQARLDALISAAGSIENKKSGIYLRMTPLMMATGDTFESTLLEDIGISNDAQTYTDWEYPQDKAVNLYPDVIFYDVGIDASYLTANLVYNTTDAVKNGACFEINALAFERQSGRMLDELERMFHNTYPDVNVPTPSLPDETLQNPSDNVEEEPPSSVHDEELSKPEASDDGEAEKQGQAYLDAVEKQFGGNSQ